MPNLKDNVRTIALLYLSFMAMGTVSRGICGMGVFDSLIHVMYALSTGGFPIKTGSIGAYQHGMIDAINIVLILIGITNFAVLLLLALIAGCSLVDALIQSAVSLGTVGLLIG